MYICICIYIRTYIIVVILILAYSHVRSYIVTVCTIDFYKLPNVLLQRWCVDGTVKCFEGGHLPLAIVAILILIFYVLLVSFVIAVVLKKIKVSASK